MRKKVIIVGGGTAGAIIAGKLQNKFDVEILDAGQSKKVPLLYRIPLAIGYLFKNKANPYLDTVPILYEEKRTIPYVISRVFGGASEINGAVHVIGSVNAWKPILKRFGVGINELKSIQRELFETCHKCIFSKSIKIRQAPTERIESLLSETLRKHGFEEIDSTWQDKPGFGPIFNNCGAFTRSSVLSLLPNRMFKKFKVRHGVIVREIIIQDDLALGVRTDNGCFFGDYVILCAGTIGTNEIMLRSKMVYQCLNRLKIGEQVKDHISLRLNYFADIGLDSINALERSIIGKTWCLIRHLFQWPSLLSGTGATLAIHWSSHQTKNVDFRINLIRFSETSRKGSAFGEVENKPGISISFTPIYPKSFGNIYLNSNDELEINPNYLKNPNDIKSLKKAILFMQRLLEHKNLNSLNLVQSEKISGSLEKFIKENIFSGHHLIGGMQNAVNQDFCIRGIRNLYACDASVLGAFPSSNIHSSILIVSELFAKKFLNAKL